MDFALKRDKNKWHFEGSALKLFQQNELNNVCYLQVWYGFQKCAPTVIGNGAVCVITEVQFIMLC